MVYTRIAQPVARGPHVAHEVVVCGPQLNERLIHKSYAELQHLQTFCIQYYFQTSQLLI